MTSKIIIGAIAVILIGAGVYYYFFRGSIPSLESPTSSAEYVCDKDKIIKADFYEGRVKLVLNDAVNSPRTITVPQLISASGARYGNEDESFVFWNKGDSAFVTEGPQGDETFSNCDVLEPGQEPTSTYASSTMGISIRYPKSFTVGETYQYTGVPNKPIHGVKFVIPGRVATGTNLSSNDTGISVEQLPRAKNCTADIFFYENVKAASVSVDGTAYTMASSSGAGAGNFYEEVVYALSGSKPCTAIRYFIHSMNIGNFEPGVAIEFDRDALIASFEKIRNSLRLTTNGATTAPSMTP